MIHTKDNITKDNITKDKKNLIIYQNEKFQNISEEKIKNGKKLILTKT